MVFSRPEENRIYEQVCCIPYALSYNSHFKIILAFAEYDTNNSGEISKQELLDWCSKYGDITDNIDSLISGADFNGDGKINYDEFICMVVKRQI